MKEDQVQSIQRYKWIRGDKIGKVEIVSGEVDGWTIFEGGGRIDSSLIDEFMESIDDSSDDEDFLEESSIPNHKSSNKTKHININSNQKQEDSPLMKLLKGMKNPEEKELNVVVSVNMPTYDMYNLLKDSFDNVDEEILKYIMNQINTDKIIESLKETVLKHY